MSVFIYIGALIKMSIEKLKKKKKIKDVTVLGWISEGCSSSSKKFLNAQLKNNLLGQC